MLWFTSDWHLGHERIIELSHRPFADVEEMNETLMRNMSVIEKNDTLYFLGDAVCGVGSTKLLIMADTFRYMRERGVVVHIIRGNHDATMKRLEPLVGDAFDSVQEMLTITVSGPIQKMDGTFVGNWKRDIVLCHYPLEHWEFESNGTYHLHGHIHGKGERHVTRRRLDIGVDGHNFKPWSLTEVVEEMRSKPWEAASHHG